MNKTDGAPLWSKISRNPKMIYLCSWKTSSSSSWRRCFLLFLISLVPLTDGEAPYNLMQLKLKFNRKTSLPLSRSHILHPEPRKLSHHHLVTETHWNYLKELNADLHFVSSPLVRCQRRHKKLCCPDPEDLIETAARAPSPCALCGGLISRRDLCTLFKVCKVSERAARRIPDGCTSGLAASGWPDAPVEKCWQANQAPDQSPGRKPLTGLGALSQQTYFHTRAVTHDFSGCFPPSRSVQLRRRPQSVTEGQHVDRPLNKLWVQKGPVHLVMRLHPTDGQLPPDELSPSVSYSQCSILRQAPCAAPGSNSLHGDSACAAVPNSKSLHQCHQFINGRKCRHKKHSPFRVCASPKNLSACTLSTFLFHSVMTFPSPTKQRAAMQRTTQRVFASAERTWLPRICSCPFKWHSWSMPERCAHNGVRQKIKSSIWDQ